VAVAAAAHSAQLGLGINELGGGVVNKPLALAFGQYGELGLGFEQLLDQLVEEGADEARSGPKRHLIPNRVVAPKGVLCSSGCCGSGW
jgi:hypothetical protein